MDSFKIKKTTQTQAIKAFCTNCIVDSGYHGNGTALMQIEACTATACPLFHHRPLTTATRKANQADAYAAMTPEQREKVDKKAEQTRQRFADKRAHDKQ